MTLTARARVYLWLVVLAATAIVGAQVVSIGVSTILPPAPRLARILPGGSVLSPEVILTLAQLLVLAIIAQQFPLSFGRLRKFDFTQAVHLAILLLAGTPLAVVLVGVGELLGQGSLMFRRDPKTKQPMRGLYGVLFNISQSVLAIASAGVAAEVVSTVLVSQTGGSWLAAMASVLTASVVLYLVNSVAVAIMVALQQDVNPVSVWLDGRKQSVFQAAGLLTLGWLTAHASSESPWVPLAVAIPASLTYVSLKRTAEAEANVRLRDEFLGVAAHELRTPLTSLRGYTQLLLSQVQRGGIRDEAKLARSLGAIDRQSAKICELIDQLLDVSRLESEQLRLRREAFDLVTLARDVTASLQPLTTEFTLRVQATTAVQVWADRLRVEQIITNLVSNATRYAGKGDTIDIEIGCAVFDETSHGRAGKSSARRQSAQAVTLAVRDYGVGIAPEYRERIFERFYQVGAASKAGGLGLGLYVTRQIVQLHGGTIAVECPPGGGTRFIVTLPAGVYPRVLDERRSVEGVDTRAEHTVTPTAAEGTSVAALVNAG